MIDMVLATDMPGLLWYFFILSLVLSLAEKMAAMSQQHLWWGGGLHEEKMTFFEHRGFICTQLSWISLVVCYLPTTKKGASITFPCLSICLFPPCVQILLFFPALQPHVPDPYLLIWPTHWPPGRVWCATPSTKKGSWGQRPEGEEGGSYKGKVFVCVLLLSLKSSPAAGLHAKILGQWKRRIGQDHNHPHSNVVFYGDCSQCPQPQKVLC